MNKTELVKAVAKSAGLSNDNAKKAHDAMISSITSSLANGENVTLIGFGTFLVKHRDARTGRNPKTGEAIEISARNAPSFKAGAELKRAVNS